MEQNNLIHRLTELSKLILVIAAAWFAFPVLVHAATVPSSCASTPQARQLDYWIGDWSVSAPGSAPNAGSKVSLALDKCMLIESWDGGRGHIGQNMFAYSADDNSWHGMFVDNRGKVHIFKGTVSAGSAQFVGPSSGPAGTSDLNRVRILRLSPDNVEQLWEKSSDNGRTWIKEFSGQYRRRKP